MGQEIGGYINNLVLKTDEDHRLIVASQPGISTPGTDIYYPAHVVGELITVTNIWTRPGNTDAYIAGDVVGIPIEFANFARVNGGTGYVVKARLSTSKKSITPRIRVHLYTTNTFTVSADNAPMQEKFADRDKRLGYFELPAMTTAIDTTNSDMSRTFDLALRIAFTCGATSRSLWALLETLDGMNSDNAQVWALTLVGDLN